MLARSAKALLSGLIDYAGLFPPAGLSMEEAVRNYARYREGEHAWILGKFVVPEGRAGEVPEEFPKSVLGVDEVKADGNFESIKPKTFVEIADVGLIAELANHGLHAKIRTGGITPDAIPHPDRVATFIRICAMHAVPFKATAGLHHPVRCMRALTYEANSQRATMHGFVNVFMAAAFPHDAERILAEEDPKAFRFEDDAAWWRDHAVTTEHLEAVRREFAISFGSCSFEEPIADLQELGWL
ncbi:MAG TPA: hypothetical protein VHU41_01065 [Thermoanaerobaculia bacterium]|jgi:hypothetical protein|nr:hypothetical protein [Thermoanaerobaculia bacterium]